MTKKEQENSKWLSVENRSHKVQIGTSISSNEPAEVEAEPQTDKTHLRKMKHEKFKVVPNKTPRLSSRQQQHRDFR